MALLGNAGKIPRIHFGHRPQPKNGCKTTLYQARKSNGSDGLTILVTHPAALTYLRFLVASAALAFDGKRLLSATKSRSGQTRPEARSLCPNCEGQLGIAL